MFFTGHIYCRMIPGNDDISRLGKHLKFLALSWQPYFVIQEEHRSQEAMKVLISHDVIETMISSCRFKMKLFSVKLSSRLAVSEILLSLTPNEMYHISHFPRSFLQDESYNTGKHLADHATSS
jgi:hypothetical protein